MKRTKMWCAFALAATLFCGGCGSGNVGEVCSALAQRVFQVCDPDDPSDVLYIRNFFAQLGGEASELEIQTATQASLTSECESSASEDGFEISEEEKVILLAAIQGYSDCGSLTTGILGLL